ncbi:MAG: hypothetical protein FWD72_00055 [Eggerthellaceae bacterium]|nr:hypothetical protein [Eggerthellaceae bacterium]
MYERVLQGTWDVFGDYLNGARESLLCIVSTPPLSDRAKSALQSSFAQLGYGAFPCTFFTLQGNAAAGAASAAAAPADVGASPATSPSSPLPHLSEKEVFAVIEGLDPLLLVITDAAAIRTCSQAYHQEVPPDQRSRVLGREVRAFSSFDGMLDDPKGKQEAWALLKSLPKRNA